MRNIIFSLLAFFSVLTLSAQQIPECQAPEDLSVLNLKANSVTLNWGLGYGYDVPTIYTLTIKDANRAIVYQDNALSAPYQTTDVNGLTPNTTYTAELTGNCNASSSGYSTTASITFTTLCSTLPVPYTQNFDTLTVLPGCTSTSGAAISYTSRYGKALAIHTDVSEGTYFVFPEVALHSNSVECSFWARPSTVQDGNISVLVGLVTDPSDVISTFEPIYSCELSDLNWREIQMNTSTTQIVAQTATIAIVVPAGFEADIFIDDVLIRQVPSCIRPEDITISNILSNSATLSWTTTNAPECRINVSSDDESFSVLANTNPYTLSGLTPNTKYSIALRGICSSNDSSELSRNAITFKTKCSVASTPLFHETFDTLSVPNTIPGCWETGWLTRFQSASLSAPFSSTASQVHTGARAMVLQEQPTGNNSYLSSQLIPIDEAGKYSLSVWVYRQNASQYQLQSLRFWVSPSYNSTAGATLLGSVPLHYQVAPAEPAANIWYNYQYVIQNTGNVYILIEGISETGASIYFDDVEVKLTPSCMKVSDISISNISSSDADITWTPGNTETRWAINYTLVQNNNIIASVTDTVTSPIANLPGLDPATVYSVTGSIKSLCSDQDTSVAAPFSQTFTTTCLPISTLPYTCGFESSELAAMANPVPLCWRRRNDANLSVNYYPNVTGSADIAHTGSGSLRFYPSSSVLYNYGNYQMAVLPEIDASYPLNTLRITLYARTQEAASTHNFIVGVITDPDDISTFVPIDSFPVSSNVYKKHEVLFDSYTGNGGYIAFMVRKTFVKQTVIYVDDVVVDPIPSCRDLTKTGVEISDITDVAARIAVTDATATTWEYAYGLAGTPVSSLTPVRSVYSNVQITNLLPSTTYSVYARRVCGTEYGNWCDAVNFTTTCPAAPVPYSDDFESYTVGTLRGCYGYQSLDVDDSIFVFSSVPGSSANQTFNHTATGSNGISSSGGKGHKSVSTSMSAFVYVHLEAGKTYQISLYAKKYDKSQIDYGYNLTFNYGFTTSNFTPIGSHYVSAKYFERYASTFSVPETNNYYVGFTTTAGRGSAEYYPYIDDILIEEIVCAPPTFALISDLTSSSAVITIDSAATAWQVAVSSFPIDIEKEIVADVMFDTVFAPVVNITGLRVNSDYYYTVRSICVDGADPSDWLYPNTFHTRCTNENIPYNENFELIGSTNCWSKVGTAGSVTRAVDQQHSGKASMLVSSANIISSEMNVSTMAPYMLSAWVYSGQANTVISIGVMFDPDDPSTIEYVDTYTISKANSWEEINIPFDTLNNPDYQDFYNARYIVISVPGGSSVYIDDLNVDFPPSCAKPANGTVTNVTSTSAQVNWTETGTASQWRIRAVPASGQQISVDVTSHPHTLSGLNASTLYTVYVSALCSASDNSPEYCLGQFVTSCGVITAPWSEDFELHAVGHTPACWDTDGSTSAGIESRLWGTYEINGNRSIRLLNWGVPAGYAMINSPEIYIPAGQNYELVYDYTHQATSGPLRVQIRRNGASSYMALASHPNTGESTTEQSTPIAFHTNAVSLAAYAGDTVRIQFMNVSDYKEGSLFVDNVKIRVANPCAAPSIKIKSVTDATAKFQIEDTLHTSWQYVLGPQGFDVTTAQPQTTSSKTIALSSLTSFTFYDIYVRSVCGSGSYSDWEKTTFQTTLVPTEIPFVTDFSNPEDNDLWTREGDVVNSFVFGVDSAALINSSHALYVSSDGIHYDYDVSVNSMASISRLFNFEDKVYDIEFDWQCTGGKYVLNGVADYGRFYLMPAYADVLPHGEGMYYRYYFWDNEIIPLDGDTCIELIPGKNHASAIVDMTGRSGAYRLVFFWFTEQDGGASHYPLSVSNLSLEELTCVPVNNLVVPEETITQTSAFVYCNNSASSLRWVISTSALLSDSVASGISATDTFTVRGLLPSTEYHVLVRSECSSSDVSPWSDAEFKTLCGPIATFPHTEDFEKTSFPPYCWTSRGWSRYTNRPYEYAHGNGCAHAGYSTDQPLVSPELMFEADRQYYVSFWLLRSTLIAYTDKMEVYVSPTTSIVDGTLLKSYETYDPNKVTEGEELVFYNVDIPEGLSGVYHIIFSATGAGASQTVYIDDVTFGIYPMCREIKSAPTVVAYTSTTVTLATENHNYTKVQYGVAPYSAKATPADITDIFDTSFVSGLAPVTSYCIFARGICSSTGDTTSWSPAVIVNTRVDDCFAPDGLSLITQQSDTMASVRWNSVPDVTLYQTVLSSAAGTDTFTTNNTSIVLSSLMPNTTYSFAVRGYCSVENLTDWSTISFTTLQTPATIPYHTGFEPTDDNALWQTTSSAYSNFTIGTDGGGRHSGSQGLYVSADGNTYSQACPTGPGNDHIYGVAYFTRTLYFDEAGNYEVSFDWKSDPISENTYGYFDAYGRAFIAPVDAVLPVDASTYKVDYPDGSIELASKLTDSQTWQRSSFVISVPEAGYRDIVFEWYSFSKYNDAEESDLSDYPLAIDNLDISRIYCLAVNNLTVLTYSDTCATILVDRSVPVDMEYAVITTNVEDSIKTVFPASSDTIVLTGLAPQTTYYFFVRQVCDSVYSSSWRSVSFRTTNAPAVLPYVCDFEDVAENNRWLFFQSQQNQFVIGASAFGDNTYSLYVSADGSSNTYNYASTSYAFAARSFYLQRGDYYVSYDWRNAGESMHDYTRMFFMPADREIPVGTFMMQLGPNTLPYSTIAVDGGSQLVSSTVMTNMESRVSIPAEGSYNLVVAWQNDHIDGENPPFVLDNLVVHQTSCLPPTATVISDLQTVGLSSAVITATQPGVDVVYAVSRTTNFADAIITDTIRNLSGRDTVLLAGTSPSTSYYLLCRSLCSDDDYSVKSVTPFLTPCGLITSFPYTESFETVSTSYMQGMISSICWTAFGAASSATGNPRYLASTAANTFTDGKRSLKLYAHKNNALVLSLPEMTDISGLRLTFDVQYEATKNMPVLSAGYLTDPSDASSFVAVCTTTVATAFTNYVVNFPEVPAGSRIAFSFVGGNTAGKVAYLDNVNVLHVVDGDAYSDTICYSEDYMRHGFVLPANSIPVGVSTYYRTAVAPTIAEPDTLYSLTLLKRPEALRTFYDTICGGQPYVSGIWNIANPQTRRYSQIFPGASHFGCDSIVELFLEVIPSSNIIYDTICSGESYQFGNQTLTASGCYTRSYTTTYSCPSTDTLYLFVVPDSVVTRASTCYANLPFRWHEKNYYATGRYTTSIAGPHGCTQTAVLDLTVFAADTTLNVSLCTGGSVLVIDTIIKDPGTYTLHRISIHNCDVNYHVIVTETPIVPEDVYDYACQGQAYSGYGIKSLVVTSDTVVTVNTRSIDGRCDSVANIHLTYVLPVTTDTFATAPAGKSFTWHNQTYDKPGDYVDSMYSKVTGCDSIVVLHLTFGGDDVENVMATFGITLYPNPAESGQDVYISLDPSMSERVASVQILTAAGQVVYSQVVDSQIADSQLTITNCQFPSGIYYVRLTTDNDRVSVQKLIIK